MKDFIYYTPTKVVFGVDKQHEVGNLLKEFKATKVLVHYGGQSAVKSGLLEQITQSIEKVGIPYVTLGGVVPNPRLSKVNEGITLARTEGVDFILAVGGGSVIDSSKAIAYGVPYDGDVWDFFSNKAIPEVTVPVGAVLTLAAAGSEMSNSTVITNEDGWLKRGCNYDISRIKFVVENPELTYTLPAYQTASGCVDIMMHTLERYFTGEKVTMQITDEMSEALLRTVMDNAKKLHNNPNDYQARAEVMWASSLSHNGLLSCGTEGGDWACHRLEHEISGMFDVAHGAGLAAIWPSWARYVYQENPKRFARLATNVFGIKGTDDNELSLKGIGAMEEFFKSVGMPISMVDINLNITEANIEEMAEKCALAYNELGKFKVLKKADMLAIYQLANK